MTLPGFVFGRVTLYMILVMALVIGAQTGYMAESPADTRIAYADGTMTVGEQAIPLGSEQKAWVATMVIDPAMAITAAVADPISTFVYANLRWVPPLLFSAWLFAITAVPVAFQFRRIRRLTPKEA